MRLAGFVLALVSAPALAQGPSSFCTAKTGLLCGPPAIAFSGASSASATSGFVISARPALACRPGILLYNTSHTLPGTPFQGGTLCVTPQGIRRAGPTNSTGIAGNCDGIFTLDLNTFAAGLWVVPACDGSPSGIPPNQPAAFLSVPSQHVNCQFWGRDTPGTGSFLSDALQFQIGP